MLAADRAWFAGFDGAEEEVKANRALRIVELDHAIFLVDMDLDVELLFDFAHHALVESLILLAFAARKLPQGTQIRTRESLSDQVLAVALDECGCDFNDLIGHVCLLTQ